MNACLHPIPAAVLVLALPAAALSQTAPMPPDAAAAAERVRVFEHRVAIAGDDGRGWRGDRVVKGAPYCADAVHETVQWLADPAGGAPNRIVRQHSSRLCRDGEGRTRQEIEVGGRKRVYLRDPVAGDSWTLDPERKVATRTGGRGHERIVEMTLPTTGWSEADAKVWRDYAERMREWARELGERTRQGVAGMPTPPVPAAPRTPPAPPAAPTAAAPAAVSMAVPQPVLISRGEGGQVSVSGGGSEVTVLRVADGAGGTALGFGPDGPWASPQMLAPRGPGTVQPLPGREIEGLKVQGERTTWQIEAGRMGNERPIQIVREVWTSPELMLTVQSRDFDPRSGERNYRLREVRRGEPDAALFRVPADFTQRGGRGEERREPPRG